jgi:uncharacterized protein (TIGR03435 family)
MAALPGYGGLRTERTRVLAQCVTVDRLIHMAYNRGNAGNPARAVRGGPAWVRTDRYTVEASADGVQNPDLAEMMRVFLADRFQILVSRGEGDEPVYALNVARGGLKIKPMAPGDCVEPPAPAAGDKIRCGAFLGSTRGTQRVLDIGGGALSNFAAMLDLDRPVIDKTGVRDRFVIHFEFDQKAVPSGAPATAIIKTLEQQLGLTLVPATGYRTWVVIERIERPR